MAALSWQAKEQPSRRTKGRIRSAFFMIPSDNTVVTQVMAQHSGQVNASAAQDSFLLLTDSSRIIL
jgi:hypothetical protein